MRQRPAANSDDIAHRRPRFWHTSFGSDGTPFRVRSGQLASSVKSKSAFPARRANFVGQPDGILPDNLVETRALGVVEFAQAFLGHTGGQVIIQFRVERLVLWIRTFPNP